MRGLFEIGAYLKTHPLMGAYLKGGLIKLLR